VVRASAQFDLGRGGAREAGRQVGREHVEGAEKRSARGLRDRRRGEARRARLARSGAQVGGRAAERQEGARQRHVSGPQEVDVRLGGAACLGVRSLAGGGAAALAREEARLEARVGVKSDRKALLSDLRDFALLRRKDAGAIEFAVRTFARLHALNDMVSVWAQ